MPKNILIIKPSALGDVVTALPALASLRASFPQARISWLVRSEFAPILEMSPGLDEIILFDRKRLGQWWYNPVVFADLMRFLSNLRKAKFDLVIDLQGLFRTGFFGWATGCKRRLGIKDCRELASFFYTTAIGSRSDSDHVIDYSLNVVSEAGCEKTASTCELMPPKEAENNISVLLEKRGISHDNYAVFIPGSAHRYKCWPLTNFSELASKIASRFSLQIIATGTSAERTYVEQMITADVPILNLAGRTSIKELAVLLRGAKIVVTNDTGPGQMAAALAVPMVMVVGSTNPARIGPLGRPQCVAAIDPAGRGHFIESSNPVHTIENVSVDMVFEKVARQLNS
jgi:heptosyltransferase I